MLSCSAPAARSREWAPVLKGVGVRSRPWSVLIFIVVLTLVASWLALPGETLDVFDIKRDVQVSQGLDLQGGVQVLLEADPPPGVEIDSGALEGTRNTIERRVNGLGVSEPLIQTRGDNQIIVELPGVEDPERAVQVIQQTALLEIIDPQGQTLPEGTLVETTLGGPEDVTGDPVESPSPDAVASPVGSPLASPVASPVSSPLASPIADAASPVSAIASPVDSIASPIAEATPVAEVSPSPESTGPVYTTIVRGADLADAFVTSDQLGRPVVGFELKDEAADRFYEFTSANIGMPMSILIDKRVISSPVINDAISDQGIISGPPAGEVDDLVVQLKAGALSVPLTVVQSRTIGPTLGQDSIDKSILAGIIGLGMVCLFMILYYRLPGVLSVVALLIYTVVTFAVFKLLSVTLTLAAIAGFILSIGMAVDANVLIFARLKEELRTGRALGSAIESGFDHAWPSIRDSNVSSMITSAILFWFGRYTGASIITGFALTLFLGVAVSMFTAITVTRTFLRLLVGSGVSERSWLFNIVDEPKAQSTTAAAD